MSLENAAPQIYKIAGKREVLESELNDEENDAFDAREIFDLIRSITDPEHPMSLEQLHVVQLNQITVDIENEHIDITFTPTIEHCSMATLIGLSLRVRLIRALPARFKVDIAIHPKTHKSEAAINKQLADKERVSAALENSHILEVVNQCLASTIEN